MKMRHGLWEFELRALTDGPELRVSDDMLTKVNSAHHSIEFFKPSS